jgi:hypothetical protein
VILGIFISENLIWAGVKDILHGEIWDLGKKFFTKVFGVIGPTIKSVLRVFGLGKF